MSASPEVARENGKKGGRPKGSVALSTRVSIKTRELFAAAVERNLQPIFEALLEEAKKGNIQAINTLLDRAWGKPAQAVNLSGQFAHFSLKDLAEYRERLRRETNKYES